MQSLIIYNQINMYYIKGVDSVPADVGLVFTKNLFNGDLAFVESYLTIKPNGGVILYFLR